ESQRAVIFAHTPADASVLQPGPPPPTPGARGGAAYAAGLPWSRIAGKQQAHDAAAGGKQDAQER
ncbi:hypothetical protein M9458_001577, partial [Cirrhinus mrigala]